MTFTIPDFKVFEIFQKFHRPTDRQTKEDVGEPYLDNKEHLYVNYINIFDSDLSDKSFDLSKVKNTKSLASLYHLITLSLARLPLVKHSLILYFIK